MSIRYKIVDKEAVCFITSTVVFVIVGMFKKKSGISVRRCCVSDQQPKYYTEKKVAFTNTSCIVFFRIGW